MMDCTQYTVEQTSDSGMHEGKRARSHTEQAVSSAVRMRYLPVLAHHIMLHAWGVGVAYAPGRYARGSGVLCYGVFQVHCMET